MQHIKLHAQVFRPVDSIAVQVEVRSLGGLQSLSLLIGHQLSTTHSQLVSYSASQNQSGETQQRQVRLKAFTEAAVVQEA